MRTVFASCLVLGFLLSSLSARAQHVEGDPWGVEPDEKRAPVPVRNGARVGLEIGLSVVLLAGGAAVGGIIGQQSADPCGPDEFICLGPLFATFFGGAIGLGAATLFEPLVVAGAGASMGGRGDVGVAYLGFLIGAASAALTVGIGAGVYALADPGDGGDAVFIASAPVGAALLIAGPLVAYEIAHRHRVRVPVTPGVALGPNGGSLTLTGSF